MLSVNSFLALGGDLGLGPSGPSVSLGRGTGLIAQELTWIIVAGLGLMILLFLWAKYLRRSGRPHHHSHHHHRSSAAPTAPAATRNGTQSDEDDGPDARHHRHRRRRRRREHRGRNPTLAETGGLPPLRPSEPPSSPSPT
ncbi:MAG: hypothetical protein KGS61_02390 [Verrucomicrobia bacterium]|nr:hypothetical protein [Verrucomicrobiota bacterium]